MPRAKNWFQMWETFGRGRTSDGPMRERVRIELEQGSR
jgi:hypothetical protein